MVLLLLFYVFLCEQLFVPAANQCLNPLLFRASLYAVYNICYGEWSFFTVSIIFYLLLGQSHLILSRNTNHLHCLHLLHLLLASVPSQQPQLQHLHIIFTISPENMSEPSRTQLLHLNRLILHLHLASQSPPFLFF